MKKFKFLFVLIPALCTIVLFQNCTKNSNNSSTNSEKGLETSEVLKITSSPDEGAKVSEANIEFTSDSSLKISCALNQETFSRCTSPVTLANLKNGPYTLTIIAVNSDDVELARKALQFVILSEVPTVKIESTPSPINYVDNFSIAFTNTGEQDSSLAYECSLDGSAFQTCTSPATGRAFFLGAHQFQVRIVDSKGNVSDATIVNWEVKECNQFIVKMLAVGGSKLAVVKLVKEQLGLGLKEAKELVDSVPTVIKSNTSKFDAQDLKSSLEEAGAEVEIQGNCL